MKFVIKTVVDASFDLVVSNFNQNLLRFVSPPIPRLTINTYEGSDIGNRMDFSLDFVLFKSRWKGHIIEKHQSEEVFWFVDEGEAMPLGLKYWRHKHLVEIVEKKCLITDKVEFMASNWPTSLLLLPGLYLQFLFRKPRYKKYFLICNDKSVASPSKRRTN